ncbi:MAG: DUF2631 domain-containing protein [Geodermatophilaceae bacterium]|nr:DUF2631 domain-containing protein [Geodermatophilaceae bacterium]
MAETGQHQASAGAHDVTRSDPAAHGDLTHAGADHAPAERPEDWGWHHEWRRSTPVIGWLFVIALLLLIVGNHEGNVENLYLIGAAAVMAFMLIRSRIARRNAWRD